MIQPHPDIFLATHLTGHTVVKLYATAVKKNSMMQKLLVHNSFAVEDVIIFAHPFKQACSSDRICYDLIHVRTRRI